MSLQSKFTVLLGLLALTVAVSLGSALLFGSVLERELVHPFRSTTTVLESLARLKRDVGQLTALLPGPGCDERGATDSPGVRAPVDEHVRRTAQSAYDDRIEVVHTDVRVLLENEWFEARVGLSTARNLLDRIGTAERQALEWFEGGDVAVGTNAGDSHYAIHELIETIEASMLAETNNAIAHGSEMRRLHKVVLFSGIAAAALFGVLGTMLFRRWVVSPVRRLREAASEISHGNFEFRIPADAPDELGLLSGEVNQMAGTIDRMQAEAVERERLAATGAMVRRLAHNIRNPLAGIHSMAELSRMRTEPESPIREHQSDIIQTVDRFNTWLTELLDVNSPLEVQPADAAVRPWLEGIVAAHRPLASMRSQTLSLDVTGAPEQARFDARHLEHAVVAILTNAIQASDADSEVEVRVEQSADKQDWDISISDRGPGIPDELLEKIWRPYFTTKRDGNGIGLAVARQIVEQHDGKLDVGRRETRGTTFTIHLPVSPADRQSAVEFNRRAENSRNGDAGGDDSGDRG